MLEDHYPEVLVLEAHLVEDESDPVHPVVDGPGNGLSSPRPGATLLSRIWTGRTKAVSIPPALKSIQSRPSSLSRRNVLCCIIHHLRKIR